MTTDFTLTTSPIGKRTTRLLEWLLIVVLCLASLKTNWRLEQLVDLDGTDETDYLSIGLNLARDGRPNAATEIFFAPIYSVWYWALSHIEPDPVRLPGLNFRILTAVLAAGLYLLLRRAGTAMIPAVIAAFFFITHRLSTDPSTRSIHFAILMLALGMWVALRTVGFARQCCALAVGAALASFSRPEYAFLSLVMFGLAALFVLYQRFKLERAEKIYIFASLGVVVVLVLIFGPPIGGGNDRSFLAFSQHFSSNYRLRHTTDFDPWWESSAIVQQVFGSSKTLLQAASHNPSEFFAHIFLNLRKLCEHLLPIGFAHRNFLLPEGGRLQLLESLFLGAALCLAVALNLKRVYTNIIFFAKTYPAILLFIFGVFGAVTAGMILTSTADRYFFPYVYFGLFLVFFALGRVQEDPASADRPSSPFLVGVVAVAVLGMAPASAYMEQRCMPIRSSLSALAALNFRETTGYVEALGTKRMEIYMNKKIKFVHPTLKTASFGEFLRVNQIGAVHVTPYLQTARSFAHDPEWIAFLAEPAKFGFKVIPLPCQESLYVRESALVPSTAVAAEVDPAGRENWVGDRSHTLANTEICFSGPPVR